MATWRSIGSISPDLNRRFLPEISHCNFYKLIIADCPVLTESHLILESWANQKSLGQLIRPIVPEQVFEWLTPCDRMISVRMGKHIRSTEQFPTIEIALFEWESEPPKPDPEIKLWLPGSI